MADQSGGLVMMREYRKGNWTLNETMVLIEAKKMDDERRMRRTIGLPASEQDSRSSGNKPAELRWKWIEDYCWRKGCMRSQNQCNDKWDNLMRDYKKVREYERRRVESSFASESSSSSAPPAAAATDTPSYWKMEKSERKERNLPSNMLPQTYQALFEVVESKTLSSSSSAAAAAAAATVSAAVTATVGSGNGSGGGQIQNVLQQSLGFALTKHQIIQTPVILPVPPLQPPPFQPPPQQPLPPPLMLPPPPPQPISYHAQPIQPTKDSSSDSDTSEYSDTSPAKRRRTMPATTAGPSGVGGGGGGNAETEETAMGAALSKSATVIANAIRESEERQDKRHKEVMSLQERRLRIEETNVEMNRQGMNGLVEAINKLASSIFSLASSSSSTSTSRQNNQHQGGPQ